jgi:uncharacterized membrane protein YbhN (UPF0104 family)
MEKYKDMTLRKKSNLKMARNLFFFILLIVLTFWIIFKDQDINQLINAITGASKRYIIVGAILMLCVYMMESINVRAILISLGEKPFGFI